MGAADRRLGGDSVEHSDTGGAVVLRQELHRLGPLQLQLSNDDIRGRADWQIHRNDHAFVVHLGGKMDQLETELDGHGGSRGPALPGEVWSVPAERRYASRARGGTIHYGVLFVDPAALGSLIGIGNERPDVRALAGLHDAFLHQSVLRLASLTRDSSDLGRIEAETLSRALCLYLFQAHGHSSHTPPRAARPKVASIDAQRARALRDYIHDNLSGPLSLATLAAVVDLSVHHLLIAFREAFGETPTQYIIAQRLRLSRRLLAETRQDITSIALEAGFSSHSHLTRAFVQRFGETPSAFRRRNG